MDTTVLEQDLQNLEVGNIKRSESLTSVERELRFTETYRQWEQAHPFTREIECLRVQVPASLMAIQDGDWFAGRLSRALVGVDPERGGLLEAAYYCSFDNLKRVAENNPDRADLRNDVDSLLRFWKGRTTYDLCRGAFSERIARGLPRDNYYRGTEISYPMFGMGGPCIDYNKLVRLGIPGLRAEIQQQRKTAPAETEAFYDMLNAALDIFVGAALRYADEASDKATSVSDPSCVARYQLIARSLRAITNHAPQSYHQAIQLVWLYALIALPKNYGRMDTYLGDLLAQDLDTGVLDEATAKEMTAGLWRLILARGDNFNNRILVGGRGRANERNADRFAFLALDVQEMVNREIPQLSLRWHRGMDPAIWEKAMGVIGKGSTFPIIYNDDVNVPAVVRAFGVSEEEAEQYVMYGCGEFVIYHRSVGSPDAAINVVKALEVTLFNGHDAFFNEPRGMAFGEFKSFDTFDAFYEAVMRQMDREIDFLAEAQATVYRVTGEQAAFPFLSLLYDDCIARGKPLLAGGVRYLGGTLEAFGSSTVSDSLLAIKKAVYDEKKLTHERLLAALAANFEGYEDVRRLLRAYPKYGNDDAEADAFSIRFNEEICRMTQEAGRRFRLDSFNIVLINNGDSILFGKTSAATPDGRKAGEPVSNGNQPGAGYDVNGLTALLTSMGKLDAGLHAGVVHNVKMSRSSFVESREKYSALLQGYFAGGGTQAMITVTDRGELERAMKEPEKYGNLIVRVGGYSERFVDLPKDIQLEVLKRTLY